jgi:peptide/nickel transport system permease protein
MIRAMVRWLGSSVVLLFVVTALTFVLASLAPGDAAKSILSGQTTSYTPQQYQQIRHELGIDQPLPVQYWHWLSRLLHGSLGTDLFSGQPVTQALNGRLGASLSMIIGTVIVSAVAGVAIGVLGAVRGGLSGRFADVASLFGLAAPNFWLALVLVELFAVQVRAFPATGYTPFGQDPVQWLRGVVLPILTLSIGASAFVARQTHDAMADVLSRDFITALRARGLSTRSIICKHALRNAAIPVVTVLGLLFISLLGGTVLIENVFSIPGLGQEAVAASGTHDLPMIEGVAFYFTVVVVVVNLLVELSYRRLNPKVRTS